MSVPFIILNNMRGARILWRKRNQRKVEIDMR